MICWKPKSTSKNCFRPTSHVLCKCAFLIWIFDKSKNNRANFLILSHLEKLNVPYFVWKNQPKQTKAARVTAIQSFDDARATRVLTLNWGCDSQIQILRGSEKFQSISRGYVLENKNWEEHDACVFRSIQCNCRELYEEKGQHVPILLIFRIFET